MKIIHKELFTFTPNDFESQHQADVYRTMLKSRGYKVRTQINISGITIIGQRTIRNDEESIND